MPWHRLSRDTVRYIQGGLVVAGTGLHRWPSNGIFYVVNLKEAHFYQKCHDTECYGFRSAAQQLPEYTMFWKYLDNTCDENFDEEGDLALMMAATQVEQLQKSAEMSDEELLVAATAGPNWPQLASTGLNWCLLGVFRKELIFSGNGLQRMKC